MAEEKILVYVDSNVLGRGSEELGRVLIKNFLHTVADMQPMPWRVVLINTGVMLATEAHECAPVLKGMAKDGVEVLSCGTCLDYYGLKENLTAGRVSNMSEIVTSFMAATKVIKA